MSISLRRGFLIGSLLMLPLFTFEAHMEAQPGGFHAAEQVRGRIENLSAGSSALVVLRDSSSGRMFDQAQVGSDGEFHLYGAASGSRGYRLEVRDGHRLLHQENVLSPASVNDLTVTLPAEKAPAPSSMETVSVARLLHTPPAKAAKLFEKAMTVADIKDSISLLEKAIAEYPEYIEARHNLAVRLGRTRQYEPAVKHFEMVLELDPSSAMTWANLAVTLEALGDSEAAETASKQALAIEPRSTLASFVLGSILLREGANLGQAAELLGVAANEFPLASLLQIDALLAAGKTAPARNALHSLVAAANGVH